jgi:hypothetical protein
VSHLLERESVLLCSQYRVLTAFRINEPFDTEGLFGTIQGQIPAYMAFVTLLEHNALGQNALGTQRSWDKTLLGQNALGTNSFGTKRSWNKTVLGQNAFGTQRSWDKTLLGQNALGTNTMLWCKKHLGQNALRTKHSWDKTHLE